MNFYHKPYLAYLKNNNRLKETSSYNFKSICTPYTQLLTYLHSIPYFPSIFFPPILPFSPNSMVSHSF